MGRVVLLIAGVAAVLGRFGQIWVTFEVSGEGGFVLGGIKVFARRNVGEEEVRREGCRGEYINIGVKAKAGRLTGW